MYFNRARGEPVCISGKEKKAGGAMRYKSMWGENLEQFFGGGRKYFCSEKFRKRKTTITIVFQKATTTCINGGSRKGRPYSLPTRLGWGEKGGGLMIDLRGNVRDVEETQIWRMGGGAEFTRSGKKSILSKRNGLSRDYQKTGICKPKETQKYVD